MTGSAIAWRRGGTPDSGAIGSGPESFYSRPKMRQPTAIEHPTYTSTTLASSADADVEDALTSRADPERAASSVDRTGRSTSREAQNTPSPAFARIRMRQTFREASDNLSEFRRSLGTTESAVWMTQFRASLESLWKFVPPEDVHRARAISAIQGVIRFQKWRDVSVQGGAMIARALELASASEFGQKDSKRIYSVLHSGHVDPFPSANEDAYDEDNSDETSD